MSKINYSQYRNILEKIVKTIPVVQPPISNETKLYFDVIIGNSESNKGVLAVIITSLLKKTITPDQDIRYHQDKMKGGYSGRTLDTNVTTPFLKNNQFPAMAESGWLTRSLEQNQPYILTYGGSIRPEKIKQSFLQVMDTIESTPNQTQTFLIYVLRGLILQRDRNSRIRLARPINLPIRTLISHLDKHFTYEYQSSGASRLPVLAVYSAYRQMILEVGRYKNCKLKPLESHNSADRKSGAIGDIEIMDEQGGIFEAIEIKHEIRITPNLVREANIKFQTEPVKRYYLLSTYEDCQSDAQITKEIIKISSTHGCQVIVNGIIGTLKYYLRLLKNPDDFIRNYAEMVEIETSIKYEHKQKWNDIITGN